MSNQLTPIALMAEADRAYLSARALFDLGDVNGACSRAYYVMFVSAAIEYIKIGLVLAFRQKLLTVVMPAVQQSKRSFTSVAA